ncbi:hypothetical protein SAMN04488543_2850 [Friedmanniella luteola]|uniref:Uncharacterized protein n=1 Tax=Friedmanniella luteola TaxID=546871 RepID=A0A1H1WZD5_9ACTN|nr:hypothetical protein SAMN04488543_2850 [Friedmanniella luteola]
MLSAAAEPLLQGPDLRELRGQLVGQTGRLLGRQVVDVYGAGLGCDFAQASDSSGQVVSDGPAFPLRGCRVLSGRCAAERRLLQPPLVQVDARSRGNQEDSPTRLLSRVHPHLMQRQLTVGGEPGSGSSGRGQLDPGGATAEMPVQCCRNPH